MADGLNRVTLLGNLGADVELRATSGGQSVLKMRLACSESYLDKNQQRAERTEWVSCVLWGKRADALSRILAKGDRVYVEGRLQTSSFEKEGQKHYRTEVNVTNVILCGGRGERGESRGESRAPAGVGGSASPQRAPAPPADDAPDYGGDDSDIPFLVDMTTSAVWWRP